MEYKFDAEGKILGRVATDIVRVLLGKNSAKYSPTSAADVKAKVFNTDKLVVSGSKMKTKMYYRHSGFVGNLKTSRLEEVMKKDSRQVLKKAVWNMLPKNRLRKQRMKNLELYKGSF